MATTATTDLQKGLNEVVINKVQRMIDGKVQGVQATMSRTSDNEPTACSPCHALDTYLPRLIRAGKRVAICDDIVERKTTAKRGYRSENVRK